MTPRSVRRAAERKARKDEQRKARNKMLHNLNAEQTDPICQPSLDPSDELMAPPVEQTVSAPQRSFAALKLVPSKNLSPARLAANRANAQLSTGPTSADGKTTVSLNAVKTGLTGQTVLLPGDDAAHYQRHIAAFENDYSPVGARETELVQSLADTAWRLRRIPALELAIYAKGRIEFANLFEHHDAAERPSLIDAETFLTYEKQLRNLQLQESRLYRRFEKDRAELRLLQQSRKEKEAESLDQAAALYRSAKKANQPFHPADLGFEFSVAQIEQHISAVETRSRRLNTAKPRTQAA